MHEDSKLIESLGGPAHLAALLGYDKQIGTQRVHNWMTRGIPARVKLDRPDLFQKQATTASLPIATEARA